MGCAFDGRAVRLIQTRGLARGHRPEDWMLMSPACWPGSGASGHGVTTPAWSPPPPHPTAGSRINGGTPSCVRLASGLPRAGCPGPWDAWTGPHDGEVTPENTQEASGSFGGARLAGLLPSQRTSHSLEMRGGRGGVEGWIGVLIHDPKTHILL